jgi:tRNA U54 and U55 pseudouridine synthase Pus10
MVSYGTHHKGRAIAQAVSCRLHASADRIRVQVRSCGICGGQSGTWADFIQILRFPLSILIPPTAPR